MATKRVPIRRDFRARLPDERRPAAERLLQLHYDHGEAIRHGTSAFYTDGRHEELIALAQDIDRVLGIRPWDDAIGVLEAALDR